MSDVMKATPGPWTATPHGDVMPVGGTFAVASCSGKSGMYRSYQANCALIVAAPDLLAALQGVLAVADRATVEFDAARAAIAKATGEQA